MKRKDATPARLTIASSRAAERRSRVPKPVNGFPPTGPTFARNPALLGRRTTPAGIYLLDRRRADIKNEKEGMKYIRFPDRSGASRWRIDETEDPCDYLRRLLRGGRLLLMDVRGGPAATGLVPRGHHALDLHDVHARGGHLPRRAGRALPQHPPFVRPADPRTRGKVPARLVKSGLRRIAAAASGHDLEPRPCRSGHRRIAREPQRGRSERGSGRAGDGDGAGRDPGRPDDRGDRPGDCRAPDA